jgi:hypothetical protein
LRYGRHVDLIVTDQHKFCGDDPTDSEDVAKIYGVSSQSLAWFNWLFWTDKCGSRRLPVG